MPASAAVVERRRRRGRKALTIVAFWVGLVLGVLLALAVLVRFAGGWGVPYFHFTTDRGSRCVNTFTGFRCASLDLADVNYFGGLELPPGTRVVTGTYRSTHDYQLDASLQVPVTASVAALQELHAQFGPCDAAHPSPLNNTGLAALCVMANDSDVAESGVPDSRVYVAATGVRRDQVRLVSLSVRSR